MLFFTPLILNSAISLAFQAAAFSPFQSNQYMNILNSKKPPQLQINFLLAYICTIIWIYMMVLASQSQQAFLKKHLTQ